MSYGATSLISCPNAQYELDQQFLGLNGSVREQSGVLEFLVSPLNSNGVLQQQINFRPGGRKIVELTYLPRRKESETSDTITPTCTSSREVFNFVHEYELGDLGTSIDWKVDLVDMEHQCMQDEMWFAKLLQSHIDVLIRTIDTKTIAKMVLNFGDFASIGGAGPVAVATKLSNGANSEALIADVKFEFEENEYMGTPFVFGSNELLKYFRRINASCCADTGVDLATYAAQNDVVMIRDRKVHTALGSNTEFFGMAPGAAQFVTFNRFAGPEGIRLIDDQSFKQGVITDPFTGISFDYIANYVCGVWHFQLSLVHDVFFLPNDIFQNNERLEKVNWLLHFNIVNP